MNIERVERILAAHDNLMLSMLDDNDFYPEGQCLSSSLLLLPCLRASEGSSDDINVAIGSFRDNDWGHAWVVAMERNGFEYFIDPTMSQFSELSEYIPDDQNWGIFSRSTAFDLGYRIRRLLTTSEEHLAVVSVMRFHNYMHLSTRGAQKLLRMPIE